MLSTLGSAMQTVREAGLSAVAAATMVVGALAVSTPEERAHTRIGSASVMIGDDTARVVERVDYSKPVERLGDVLLSGGAPDAAIVDLEVAAVWEAVDRIWPASRRSELIQLSVIREGPAGLVGVVHRSSTGGWILSIDAADMAEPAVVAETIVHELAHVVTLGPDQFRFGNGDCDGVAIELGCAQRDSVIARYASRFRAGSGLDPEPGEFVNDYAASAVHEDVAETFTAWVFDWPVEGPVIDEKLRFLAGEPGLTALRAELSARVAA